MTQHNATHEKCIRMAMGQVLTRAREGGGQILPFPHVFRRYNKNLPIDFYELFGTWPKMNGASSEKKTEIEKRLVTFWIRGM